MRASVFRLVAISPPSSCRPSDSERKRGSRGGEGRAAPHQPFPHTSICLPVTLLQGLMFLFFSLIHIISSILLDLFFFSYVMFF